MKCLNKNDMQILQPSFPLVLVVHISCSSFPPQYLLVREAPSKLGYFRDIANDRIEYFFFY